MTCRISVLFIFFIVPRGPGSCSNPCVARCGGLWLSRHATHRGPGTTLLRENMLLGNIAPAGVCAVYGLLATLYWRSPPTPRLSYTIHNILPLPSCPCVCVRERARTCLLCCVISFSQHSFFISCSVPTPGRSRASPMWLSAALVFQPLFSYHFLLIAQPFPLLCSCTALLHRSESLV